MEFNRSDNPSTSSSRGQNKNSERDSDKKRFERYEKEKKERYEKGKKEKEDFKRDIKNDHENSIHRRDRLTELNRMFIDLIDKFNEHEGYREKPNQEVLAQKLQDLEREHPDMFTIVKSHYPRLFGETSGNVKPPETKPDKTDLPQLLRDALANKRNDTRDTRNDKEVSARKVVHNTKLLLDISREQLPKLIKELGRISSENETLRREIESLKTSKKSDEKTFLSLQKHFEELARTNRANKAKLSQLRDNITEKDDKIKELGKELEELKINHEQLRATDNANKALLSQLRDNITEKDDKIKELGKELEELKINHEQLRATDNANKALLSQLRDNITEKDEEIKKLEEVRESGKNTLISFQKRFEGLASNYYAKRAQLMYDIDKKDSRIKDLEEELERSNKALTEFAELIKVDSEGSGSIEEDTTSQNLTSRETFSESNLPQLSHYYSELVFPEMTRSGRLETSTNEGSEGSEGSNRESDEHSEHSIIQSKDDDVTFETKEVKEKNKQIEETSNTHKRTIEELRKRLSNYATLDTANYILEGENTALEEKNKALQKENKALQKENKWKDQIIALAKSILDKEGQKRLEQMMQDSKASSAPESGDELSESRMKLSWDDIGSEFVTDSDR